MEYFELFIEYFKEFDILSSKFLRSKFNEKIVAILGGPYESISKPISNYPTLGLRDYFIRCYTANGLKGIKYLLPEEFDYDDIKDIYGNLLDFEMDFLHFSDLTLIFIESPGSIAELGIIVSDTTLYNKLSLCFLDDTYSDKSFITRGIIAKLRKFDVSITYHKNACGIKIPDNDLDVFLDHSIKLDEKLKKRLPIDELSITKTILIICYEVIRIAHAITIYEIQLIIEDVLELRNINENRLRQYLFILQCFELIKVAPYCDEEFWLPQNKEIKLIEYKLKKTTNKFNDEISFIFNCRRFIATKEHTVPMDSLDKMRYNFIRHEFH